jgi:hypothetical protein
MEATHGYVGIKACGCPHKAPAHLELEIQA